MGVYKGYQPNIFRAVSGSLFSSPVNWSRGYVPTGSDVADIRDNCTIDVSRTIGTLVVKQGVTASINTGLTFQVNDIIDVKGHLSCSGAPTVNVLSNKNTINSLSAGSSNFHFLRSGNQNVPGVTYNNLIVRNSGVKTLIGHTLINGNLDLQGNSVNFLAGILECASYNLSVIGQTFVGSDRGKGAQLKKSGAGNILFVGLVSTDNLGSQINLSGNPNVEMRGGFNNELASSLVSGTGTWTFTTNNQSINGGYSLSFYNNIIISGAITITNTFQVNLFGTLDGNNINSKWVTNNILDLYNATTPFATLGSLDYTTNTNASIGFRFNGNFTLPATTFQGLRIGGTGTKTLSGNTLVQRSLFLLGNNSAPGTEGILQCSTFDLQVNLLTAIGGFGVEKGATLLKNGAGNLLFIGNFTTSNGGDTITLTGNPTIEFRGGISLSSGGNNWGTGSITFSTNSQTCYLYNLVTFKQNILISGAIIVDAYQFITSGSIDGNNAGSTIRQIANSVVTYNNATQPMATGILDTSTNLNTWIYGSGSQNVKGGTYRNLTLNGGGTKTLQGNVSVQNTYTLTSPATLNLNGFTLTNP
jgi:hypothetical protein